MASGIGYLVVLFQPSAIESGRWGLICRRWEVHIYHGFIVIIRVIVYLRLTELRPQKAAIE
jgi:hypothetical protein